MSLPFTTSPAGLRLAVRVTVRARRNEFIGLVEGPDGRTTLGVRLAAPPVEGAANKALQRLIADRLDLAISNVAIISGASSRFKMIELIGAGDVLARRLADLFGEDKC